MDQDSFLTLCSRGDADAVRAALKKNERRKNGFFGLFKPYFDINGTDRNGRFALYFASSEGHAEVARLLIEHGADVDKRYDHFTTPLYLAAGKGHTEIVRLLIGKGADVHVRSETGGSPLLRAAGQGHAEIVRLLIESGANIDVDNIFGHNALILATGNGHSDVVGLLLEKGIRIDGKTDDGKTAFKVASEKEFKAGNDGNRAMKRRYGKIVEMLVAKGGKYLWLD